MKLLYSYQSYFKWHIHISYILMNSEEQYTCVKTSLRHKQNNFNKYQRTLWKAKISPK